MANAMSGGSLRLTPTADDPVRGDATVILDTAWTPPTALGSSAEPTTTIGLRDVAARVLASVDLIAETSGHLDRWAGTSGVIERLTIKDTSFWFYVRLRHWAWLQER